MSGHVANDRGLGCAEWPEREETHVKAMSFRRLTPTEDILRFNV